jgi:hypothetical protein
MWPDGNACSFNEELRDLVVEDYYLCYSRRDAGSQETPIALAHSGG